MTTNYSKKYIQKPKMPINLTNTLETLLLLSIKYKYKNWFHLYIWLAIDITGKQTKYSSREVVKYFQSQYQDTHLHNILAASTINK